jgi:hypothetical protein
MRPIIYTTQRTGSTIVTESLGNLCMQHYGYKNILYEYFGIDYKFRCEYKKENDKVILSDYERTNKPWFQYPIDELSYRLSLIDDDYNYMIKVMADYPDYFKDIIESMVIANFDVIYLERRDKIKQLISYLATSQTNISHYSKHPDNVYFHTKEMHNPIIYNKEQTNDFIITLEKYSKFKKEHPSKYPTIYYEDFMSLGGRESAVIQILNLDITDYEPYNIITTPTPYKFEDVEEQIINKKDWLSDKQRIIDVLQQI